MSEVKEIPSAALLAEYKTEIQKLEQVTLAFNADYKARLISPIAANVEFQKRGKICLSA